MNEKQIERVAYKLQRFEKDVDKLLYRPFAAVPTGVYLTKERLHGVPDARFTPVSEGYVWGGAGQYAWFAGSFTVPKELDGQRLFLMPAFGGYEGMLYVDGRPVGNFAQRITFTAHGNHYCKRIVERACAGQTLHLAVACYAGHDYIGKMPEDDFCRSDFTYTIGACKICVVNEDVWDFYYNLKILNELWRSCPSDSFIKGRLSNVLLAVDKRVYLAVDDCEYGEFVRAVADANDVLRRELYSPAHPSCACGEAGIIGHSHIDTAWLWTADETVEKCARTYANQLTLMEQYPEYLFVQSSPYHTELMRRHYPDLFERIKKQVEAGRYELNGGAWIECDCNVIGGESMIRQFLWGQRYLKRYFGVRSDTFWLPDTFGYSGAIPQIMKGCGIDYFCTTKMEWADIDEFPADTFVWKGIDGTPVFAHFNKTNLAPAPEDLITYVCKPNVRNIRRKDVTQKRLISFGHGDGGGGPETGMLEMARRCANLEGCPKAVYTRVGDFMRDLESTAINPPVWEGELYLNAHRGTLTTLGKIKRNNRLAEQALYRAEYAEVFDAVRFGREADGSPFAADLETVLVDQFHDILPGTCIPEVNETVYKEVPEITERWNERLKKSFSDGKKHCVTLWNPLAFDRADPVKIAADFALDLPCAQQTVTDVYGKTYVAAAPALGGMSALCVRQGAKKTEPRSAFRREGNVLITPFAKVTFADNMTISSFIDLRNGFELCGAGENFNTFLMCEDYPLAWDSWDVDADNELKFANVSRLLKSETVADGAVEYRIRSKYRIGRHSTLEQDMVFYADTARVDFETVLSWGETHRFLKVAFDTDLHTPYARSEVQFGHVLRPTTRNTVGEQEMFEALCHKYVDLSETDRGAALLNDCKYGSTVKGGSIRLSLLKSGTHPDGGADRGVHEFAYAFLPHVGGFSADGVVKPAYAFNQPVRCFAGAKEIEPLFDLQSASVLVEAVKPCEDAQNAYIVRLYECSNTKAEAELRFRHAVEKVEETDMLENTKTVLDESGRLMFRPFEIKTIKVYYAV